MARPSCWLYRVLLQRSVKARQHVFEGLDRGYDR
jgi:hypothetical protein